MKIPGTGPGFVQRARPCRRHAMDDSGDRPVTYSYIASGGAAQGAGDRLSPPHEIAATIDHNAIENACREIGVGIARAAMSDEARS